MNPENLHIARHLLRRAHEDYARRNDEDLDLIATAYEELCELKGRLDLLTVLCQLTKHPSGDRPDVPLVLIIGAAVGLSDPVVLDFKASAPGRVKPKNSRDLSPVAERSGD